MSDENEKTTEEIQEEVETQDSILDLLGFEPSEEEAENDNEENDESSENESEEESDDNEESETGDESSDSSESSEESDGSDDEENESSESGEENENEEDPESSDELDELPKDELTELREANKKLLALIESGVAETIGIAPKPEPIIESSSKNDEESNSSPTLAELIGDVDFNDMQDDPAKFVELLQKVVDHTRQSTIDGLQADLPTIVTERATQAISMQNLVDSFYRDNKDLAAVKKTVSAVAQNVGAEHPDWDMSKVLTEAAKKTRQVLGTKQPVEKAPKKKLTRKGKRPAIPKAKGKHKATQKKLSKEQLQINDLITDY